jgi:diacylglycerol kinase (ATP)
MTQPPALVANARSHCVARRGARLNALARERPDLPMVWFDNPAAFEARIGALLDAGTTTFFVEGGDGTVLALLSSCYRHAPSRFARLRFALLPGGSTNLAHAKLGLRKTRLADLLELADAGEATPVRASAVRQPVLVVTPGDVSKSQAGFLLSTGALARGMDHVQHRMFGSGPRGSVSIAAALLRLMARPERFRVRDGGHLFRSEALSLKACSASVPDDGCHAFSLATTLPSLSLGLDPFWGEGRQPIRLTYAPWPAAQLRRAVLKSMTGTGLQGLERDGYRSIRTGHVAMKVDGPVMLDGEMLAIKTPGDLQITHTDAVSFLR